MRNIDCVLIGLVASLSVSEAFLPPPCHLRTADANTYTTSTKIYGAFNKRNKQGDLMKKMQEAKKQRELREMGEEEGATTTDGAATKARVTQSDEEVKKMNDMKRFEELLNRESATLSYDFDSSTNYMTKQQEEEMLDATFSGRKDRMFEGDPAPTEAFEDLTSIMSENALGKSGAERIVPWLNSKLSKQKDYLIVITDPREQSTQLRNTMKVMEKGLKADVLSKTIVINADTPAANRKWLKKQDLKKVKIFTDEKREWMREYTALGEQRWSMTMFILADGKVQKLIRELDEVLAVKAISNAVKSLE